MKTYDLYTDTGGTLLADGKKLSKDDVCVEAIGAMDEINSFLGLIYAQLADEDLKAIIDYIQRNLCRINSVLGNANVYRAVYGKMLRDKKREELKREELKKEISQLQEEETEGVAAC